jgi:hypothetical protein
MSAAPDAVFTSARDHYFTEEYISTEGYIKASGMAFTFLRDNFYIDFLIGLSGEDGVIRGPAGGAHHEHGCVRDATAGCAHQWTQPRDRCCARRVSISDGGRPSSAVQFDFSSNVMTPRSQARWCFLSSPPVVWAGSVERLHVARRLLLMLGLVQGRQDRCGLAP